MQREERLFQQRFELRDLVLRLDIDSLLRSLPPTTNH